MYVSSTDNANLDKMSPAMREQYLISREIDELQRKGRCIVKGFTAKEYLRSYMSMCGIQAEQVTWGACGDVPYIRLDDIPELPYRIAYMQPPETDITIYAF